MGIFFKNKRNTKNTSDNNINITTSTDVMFQIGNDLGQIKTLLKSNTKEIKTLHDLVKDHEKRITKLEQHRNNKYKPIVKKTP